MGILAVHLAIVALHTLMAAGHEDRVTWYRSTERPMYEYEDYADMHESYSAASVSKISPSESHCTMSHSKVDYLEVCDLLVRGFDGMAGLLPRGIDGVYQYQGCKNGKPFYVRSPYITRQTRTLWYSNVYWDWNLSEGENVTDSSVLAFGGCGPLHRAVLPEKAMGTWFINTTLSDVNAERGVFVTVEPINITCVKGQLFMVDAVPQLEPNATNTALPVEATSASHASSSVHMLALIAATAVGVVATLSGLAVCVTLLTSWQKRRYIRKALRTPLAKSMKEPPANDKDLEAQMDQLLQTTSNGWVSGPLIKARHASCLGTGNCLAAASAATGSCMQGGLDHGMVSEDDVPAGSQEPYLGPSTQEVHALGYSSLNP